MKSTQLLISVLATFAIGAPIEAPAITTRQIENNVVIIANDYVLGGCKDIIFFWARGTAELGNMGQTLGPPVGTGLKDALGAARVAVQGIDYPAFISTNFIPGGADVNGIKKMHDLLNDAASKCPDSILLAGGYSQGAALTHRAIEDLPQSTKHKIAGVVTFGDTQNVQDNGQIPHFPREKVKIFCKPDDNVCKGNLDVGLPHLDYYSYIPEADAFLVGKVNDALA